MRKQLNFTKQVLSKVSSLLGAVSIEEFKETDKPAVLGLMREIFAREKMRKAEIFNADYRQWQYEDNPFGRAIAVLAKDGANIIGQYANIPLRLKFKDSELNAALGIDLMVRSAYRRQGLFKRMAEAANTALSEQGVSVCFAFPSRPESSAGFINKLGWFNAGEPGIMVKAIFGTKKGTVPKKGDSPLFYRSPFCIMKIREFPEEINDLWDRVKPDITIGIVKTRDYLNWRYCKNPSIKYDCFLLYKKDNSLAGFFVLRTVEVYKIKVGLIVDMLCVNEADAVKALADKAAEEFLLLGVHLCAVLKTRFYEHGLRKAGFIRLAEKLNPKRYNLIVHFLMRDCLAKNARNDTLLLKNLDNWHLNFGDWDVV